MKKNATIKTPSNNFIKCLKDFNQNEYYSFLYNHSVKNKQTNQWEIKERYVINVMNIEPNPDSEITLTEILEAKPQIMTSKDGREFLNCVLWVTAENKQSQPTISNNGIEEDVELPF